MDATNPSTVTQSPEDSIDMYVSKVDDEVLRGIVYLMVEEFPARR